MNLAKLRDLTPARVALGRVGDSLPTRELLEFQMAHARARDAVHVKLDPQQLALQLQKCAVDCLLAHSAAPNRAVYLRRPDLGRRLSDGSRELLTENKGRFDVALTLADGLSALAVERHIPSLFEALVPRLRAAGWKLAPVVIVEQGRVAIGDEVAQCLGASQAVVFIGERPGLSSPDSLGVYLTWSPHPGITDANRNCISNIRAEGLSYRAAADALIFLMTESRQRKLSGFGLKQDRKMLE